MLGKVNVPGVAEKLFELLEAFLAAELDRMVSVNPAQRVRKDGRGIAAALRKAAVAAEREGP